MLTEALARNENAGESLFLAAFDGDPHNASLELVSEAFPEVTVLIVGQDSTRLAGNFVLHRGTPADIARAFAAELSQPDGWLRAQWRMDPGHVYQETDLGQRGGPLAAALGDQPRPCDCLSGVVFSREGARQLALEVRYPRHREAALRQPLRDFLRALTRQLELAARIARLRRARHETEQLIANLLDLVPFPIILTDGDRRVSRMNARAEALLSIGRVLSVGPDQCLHMADPAAEGDLLDVFDDLSHCLKQRAAMIPVRRRPQDPREILSIVRLTGGTGMSWGQTGTQTADGSARFAVICEDLGAAPEISHETLWRLYGLSSKESELALSLLSGLTIGDYALRRKVSKETLRNQLAAIMRKTETSRQPELVALLTRLAAVNAAV